MHNVSLQSDEEVENAEHAALDHNDEEMFNAIVASLIDYTSNDRAEEEKKKAEEEQDRQLKEILVLSKLENEKKTGKLNLDALKRKPKVSPDIVSPPGETS